MIDGIDFLQGRSVNLTQSVDAARAASVRSDALEGREDEAAHGFEKILAVQLVREMRRALPDGLFGKGSGSDVFESWFDDHVGSVLADQSTLGLAGMVKTALGGSAAADAGSGGDEGGSDS